MAKLSPARRCALALVSECRRRDARVRDLMRHDGELESLDLRDRALAFRLVTGVVATSGLLDEVLARYLRKPSQLEPRVRDALRLAAFEGLYLDTHAAVVASQGVELVRVVAPRAASLANAVLRRLLAEARPEFDAARAACEAGACGLDDLHKASGLPLWLLERVREARGDEAVRSVALSQLEAAPVYVAANAARHDADACEALLRDAGSVPLRGELPGCFRVEGAAELGRARLVADVDVVVADLAAQLVACIASPRPGTSLLEVGQGRGTKSVLLENAALREGGFARIMGIDSEEYKTSVTRRRMERAGLGEWVSSETLDARLLGSADLAAAADGGLGGPGMAPTTIADAYDVVFVDAPCSGTGTMRRHPEIAWRLASESLAGDGSLPELQLQILRASSARVARGGMLAYATCSLLAEENERVVEAFLDSEEGRGFALVPAQLTSGVASLPAEARALVDARVDGRGLFQTAPAIGSCDGHFCAVMRRA